MGALIFFFFFFFKKSGFGVWTSCGAKVGREWLG